MSDLMSTLTGPNLGGSLAGRIFPVALTLPFLLGWQKLQGQYAGLYGPEFGLAIFTTANVLTFAGLVWFGSRSLNKADAEHQRAAVRLEEANEQLCERARVLDLAQVLVRDIESRIVEWNLSRFPRETWAFSSARAIPGITNSSAVSCAMRPGNGAFVPSSVSVNSRLSKPALNPNKCSLSVAVQIDIRAPIPSEGPNSAQYYGNYNTYLPRNKAGSDFSASGRALL